LAWEFIPRWLLKMMQDVSSIGLGKIIIINPIDYYNLPYLRIPVEGSWFGKVKLHVSQVELFEFPSPLRGVGLESSPL
ncbi:MAG: hypothetical protein AAFQ91_34575, partial [Cyanobacteria bacterium J06621_15]